MLLREVVVFSHLCLLNALVRCDRYRIPEPKIEVFKPEGFRISIEDTSGISFVAFHVNINENLRHQDVGEFSKEVFHPVNGRWTFEVPNACISVGDQVYYWLFLIRGRVGYRKEGTSTVTKLERGPFVASSPPPRRPPPEEGHATTEICKSCTSEEESQAVSTTSFPEVSPESHLNICEGFLLNTAQSLIKMQSQIEAVRKTNKQLTDLLERYPDAKMLTLSGGVSSNEDPAMTVLFTIREKLQLNPDIVSAVKKGDGSIAFQVATIDDKVEILEAAKEKLKDSKITIS